MLTLIQPASRTQFYENSYAKGSRNNNFPEFAPRFRSGCDDLSEHNRRRSKTYAEDCVSKDRRKLACRWDAKMGSDCFASPKDLLKKPRLWQSYIAGEEAFMLQWSLARKIACVKVRMMKRVPT